MPLKPNLELVAEASKWVGVQEQGFNKGPDVERFQKAVDGKAEGEAWCMAFIQFCIKEIEARLGVRSPIYRAEHCMTVWNKSPKTMRIERPEPGCIVIWRHGTTSQGHTGLCVSVEATTFRTIEGNTGAGTGVVREGDGVYRRARSTGGAGTMKIVGYLRPFSGIVHS